ncbi:TolC family protein [Legionella fallonii]|uniref:Outer membrane efflux protein n=1 Tax=Legionella fallonii LLAP-10 TaxID=1212491 RepID=A0A098G424_9GAMM|nr:TolC family protein [Legionella fallonii]CEG57227.1 Outer membrane efflux protein [Legionella fallonii LLAP-10]
MKLKKNYLLLLFFLLILLVGGCCKNCLTPDRKVNYPTQTRNGVKYRDNKEDLSRVAWWKKLHDPQLNQLIMEALSCNNQIKSANATIKQAQAQLKSAQYAWIPTLDGSANGFSGTTWHTHINPTGPLATSSLFSNISNLRFHGYYSGFVPRYSVNILNNIATIKAAKASLAIEQAQAQATKLGIISQMSGSYFMLLSQREQLKLEKTLVKDLQELRKLEQVRYKSGISDIETVTSIEQDIAQEETKVPQIEKVVVQTENTIRLLLNQNPGPIVTRNSLLALNINHLIPKNLPSSILKNRPDVIIALNNVKSAYAKVGVSYSAFFPTISLTGLFGHSSVDLANLLKLSTNLWVDQATATTKLFNASAYQDIKAAKAGFSALYYEYIQTLRSVFADVDNNLTNEQKDRVAYLQTYKAYLAAKKTYSIVLTQYEAGAKDYRNVVNAKINLDRNRLSLVQEKAQLLDSIVQVYNAVAGGYDV